LRVVCCWFSCADCAAPKLVVSEATMLVMSSPEPMPVEVMREDTPLAGVLPAVEVPVEVPEVLVVVGVLLDESGETELMGNGPRS
jgi:hypothetical protein